MSDDARIWMGTNDIPSGEDWRCDACGAGNASYAMLYRAFCERCMVDLARRILRAASVSA